MIWDSIDVAFIEHWNHFKVVQGEWMLATSSIQDVRNRRFTELETKPEIAHSVIVVFYSKTNEELEALGIRDINKNIMK